MDDDRAERRAALVKAEQLILQIGECLRAAVPERYDSEAAPHLQVMLTCAVRSRARRYRKVGGSPFGLTGRRYD